MTSSDAATFDGCQGDASLVDAGLSVMAAEETRPAAILRGSARGLELVVRARATVDAIALALTARLEEAPAFFRGNDVRVQVEDGPLAAGCLARLDELATRFELRIVEVGARRKVTEDDAVPAPNLATGSASAPVAAPDRVSVPVDVSDLISAPVDVSDLVSAPVESAAPPNPLATQPSVPVAAVAPELAPEVDATLEGARIVVGPVRSGVILEHPGHLVVLGDVNPGAEIRAAGNIMVLGRLRGIAHAGIGHHVGFILALRLEPQQLRICRTVARASDSDTPSAQPELAHVTGDLIIVEPYQGRLPRSLAASI